VPSVLAEVLPAHAFEGLSQFGVNLFTSGNDDCAISTVWLHVLLRYISFGRQLIDARFARLQKVSTWSERTFKYCKRLSPRKAEPS
jgi:hypothetical protein